ncbi:SH3 domain-containing protein, partial [candidate division KSB1 bacterium]|nr:SH3 domain-containing protein [candidate division KSB1 bacterium]NIR71477.1 SH3 domain-containing protein [candidate division KSB1 bacterium]NIS23398.1 SH3 domain-containing protein [candidate division KSB1 bacterium]NIT70289.1 SH3 domain-containing protein [candidate division KSB1 bacterium]NIU24012.1 SH3 domain-containing protein [candidate division KSB1 bacterium]
NPKNEDVNFNLELANLSVVDRIPEIPRVFFAAWIYDFANLISLPMLGVLTGVMYVALVTLLVYRILRRSKAFRRGNLTAIIISGVLLVVFASLLALRIYENENKLEAIVLIPKVDIRNEPNNTATEMFTLHEGVKVEVKDQQGRWVKIRLADGKVGWVKNEKIEII